MDITLIDSVDRHILYELDHDSRQSIADLSRKLKLGRDRIVYRIKKLQDNAILRKCSTMINPYKFGFTMYKTYLQFERNRPRIESFRNYLKKHPRIYWFADLEGRWDLLFAVYAKTPVEFSHIQDEILSEFSDILVGFNTSTVIEMCMSRKNYLLSKGSDYFKLGGTPDNPKIDDLDFGLLKILSKDARISNSELAEMLDSTPTVIKYRIDRLKESGVIAGYRTEIDLPKIGMSFFKTQIFHQSFKQHAEEEFVEYCNAHQNITYVIRQIGDCKLELELEVNNFEHYSEIIKELRQRFPKFIGRVETLMIRKERFNWMPLEHVMQLEKRD